MLVENKTSNIHCIDTRLHFFCICPALAVAPLGLHLPLDVTFHTLWSRCCAYFPCPSLNSDHEVQYTGLIPGAHHWIKCFIPRAPKINVAPSPLFPTPLIPYLFVHHTTIFLNSFPKTNFATFSHFADSYYWLPLVLCLSLFIYQ